MKRSRFNLFLDRSAQFRFNVQSRNGKIIASSEGYETKQAALKGIASLRRCCPLARVVNKTRYPRV